MHEARSHAIFRTPCGESPFVHAFWGGWCGARMGILMHERRSRAPYSNLSAESPFVWVFSCNQRGSCVLPLDRFLVRTATDFSLSGRNPACRAETRLMGGTSTQETIDATMWHSNAKRHSHSYGKIAATMQGVMKLGRMEGGCYALSVLWRQCRRRVLLVLRHQDAG